MFWVCRWNERDEGHFRRWPAQMVSTVEYAHVAVLWSVKSVYLLDIYMIRVPV